MGMVFEVDVRGFFWLVEKMVREENSAVKGGEN
jgi:hypothetical protein